MARTYTNRELYERSLDRIFSLSNRQLNMTYITYAYFLMGYKLVEVDESTQTFTMVNKDMPFNQCVMFNYSASKTTLIANELQKLDETIFEFCKHQVSKGFAATMMARFNTQTHIKNPDNFNVLLQENIISLRRVGKLDPQLIETINKNMNDAFIHLNTLDKGKVAHRILDLIKDSVSPNSNILETLLNHNVKARPLVNSTPNSLGRYGIVVGGYPSHIGATSYEEACEKAYAIHKNNLLKEWDKKNKVEIVEEVEPVNPIVEGVRENVGRKAGVNNETPIIVSPPDHFTITPDNKMIYDTDQGQMQFDFDNTGKDSK